MTELRPEPRPWFCIELSSFQEETGDVGQRPGRIIRAGDRNLGVIEQPGTRGQRVEVEARGRVLTSPLSWFPLQI